MALAPEIPSARRSRARQHLLSVIRDRGTVTRAHLCQLTGLSRAAVADTVQDLLAAGLVVEVDREPHLSGRGRPSALLRAAHPDGHVIGIDFGHAHVAVALADTGGHISAERRSVVDVDNDAAAALDTAADLVHTLLGEAGLTAQDLLGVTAGIPGPLDAASKTVRSPTILSSWVDRDPERELAERIGHTVIAGNDADMGAHGEFRFGAAQGCQDFLYIKASHGIGAGLFLGGQTYRGATGIAGEIGHTQLRDANNWCRCGNRGCLETVVSITEIHRQLAEMHAETAADQPLDLSLYSVQHSRAGSRLITEAGRTIGHVLADLCNCLNPALIVLGGELGTAGQPLIDGVKDSINRYAQPATAAAVDIRTAQHGLRSELLGAVAQAIHHSLYTT